MKPCAYQASSTWHKVCLDWLLKSIFWWFQTVLSIEVSGQQLCANSGSGSHDLTADENWSVGGCCTIDQMLQGLETKLFDPIGELTYKLLPNPRHLPCILLVVSLSRRNLYLNWAGCSWKRPDRDCELCISLEWWQDCLVFPLGLACGGSRGGRHSEAVILTGDVIDNLKLVDGKVRCHFGKGKWVLGLMRKKHRGLVFLINMFELKT